MITLTREEAQQIEQYIKPGALVPVDMQTTRLLVNALRARLSAPECVCGEPNTAGVHRQDGPCYQQPERKWQGLTDEEIKQIVGGWGSLPIDGYTRKLFDQIEAKLKEKNND